MKNRFDELNIAIGSIILTIGVIVGIGLGKHNANVNMDAKLNKAVAELTNGFEDARLLYCSGPSQKTFEMAALAPHIKYNGKYFEILNEKGEHFVYVPSQFETCRTVPIPSNNDRSADIRSFSGEGSTLSSQ